MNPKFQMQNILDWLWRGLQHMRSICFLVKTSWGWAVSIWWGVGMSAKPTSFVKSLGGSWLAKVLPDLDSAGTLERRRGAPCAVTWCLRKYHLFLTTLWHNSHSIPSPTVWTFTMCCFRLNELLKVFQQNGQRRGCMQRHLWRAGASGTEQNMALTWALSVLLPNAPTQPKCSRVFLIYHFKAPHKVVAIYCNSYQCYKPGSKHIRNCALLIQQTGLQLFVCIWFLLSASNCILYIYIINNLQHIPSKIWS